MRFANDGALDATLRIVGSDPQNFTSGWLSFRMNDESLSAVTNWEVPRRPLM